MHIVEVNKWFKDKEGEILELVKRPLAEQLSLYENAGTGIGFVMFLEPIIKDTGEDDNPPLEMHIKMQPVVKLRSKWYTTSDEDFSDLIGATIRLLRP